MRISDWSSDVCSSDLFAAERQALVNAYVLHPQGTCLLDHSQALLVMQEEAAPARPPLGVALPGRDAPGPGQLVHALEVARLVRVDATMDEQPLGSRHLVDDAADLVGLLNGQELFLPARGNEGKHHHVGVGIEEDILDELLGAAERSEEHTSELQ